MSFIRNDFGGMKCERCPPEQPGLSLISRWRTMFALATVPAVLLGLGMAYCPESPRWLYKVSYAFIIYFGFCC